MSRRALLALLLTVPLAPLAACSGGGEAAPTVAPATRLEAARDRLVAAKNVHLALTSADVPERQNGVTAAEGDGEVDATAPKFAGTIDATVRGVTGRVDLVTIGDDAWMKFFTPGYVKTDLTTLGAPNPSRLFDPAEGVPALLVATGSPKAANQVRDGRDVLDELTGTLPAARIKTLLGLGPGTGTFDVRYGITAQGELRRATITGPFFEGAASTYTLRLTDYGTSVTITRP